MTTCVALAYSKSLLYLISRALERSQDTGSGHAEAWVEVLKDDVTFEGYQDVLEEWQKLAKGVVLDPAVLDKVVPTVREKDKNDTIPATHGSFDNNLDVVNRALARILGKQPKVPITDLRGF